MDLLKRLKVYRNKGYDSSFNSNLNLDEMVSVLKEIGIGNKWHKREKDSYDYVYGQMDYWTEVEIRHEPPVDHTSNTYLLRLDTYCNTEELLEMQRKVQKIIANLA